MVSLKQLVDEQKWNEMSDLQVIEAFFTLNDLEEEGMDLIHELTKSKINKTKEKHRMVQEWGCMLPSTYLYENYDLKTADKLHMMELNFLINGGELSSKFLQWATENLPNIKRPSAYFNPLVDWLEEKGIKFKSE